MDWSTFTAPARNTSWEPDLQELIYAALNHLNGEGDADEDAGEQIIERLLAALRSTTEAASRAEANADFERRVLSALEAREPTGETDLARRIAEVVEEESEGGAAAYWKSCSGCHETVDGQETGHYPYSKAFGCYLGAGCRECGGIGAVWHYWTAEALADMAREGGDDG